MEISNKSNFIELSADIVSAYVSNNSVASTDLPSLIKGIYDSLLTLGKPADAEPAASPLKPAVPIRKSVTPDYIVCLEDGKQFRSLRRHLSSFGLTPEEYRQKWNLPDDYPMVAPNYAAARSKLAKDMGLGQKGRKKLGNTKTAGSRKNG